MNKEKVSILISNYNKEKYIDECILSCLNQNYNNLEIIVCDNNSTDNSLDKIKRYSNKIIYKSKERISNYGPVNQIDILTEAFKISSGNIICLLDSDDFFFSNKIENIVFFFDKDKNLDILFDIPYTKIKNKIYPIKIKKKFNKYIWPSTIPTSGISFKRSFFEYCLKLNLFDNYPMLEIDFRLNLFAQKINRNYQISNDKLTFYRNVKDGIMSNLNKFSFLWWKKRYQAHFYSENIFKLKNLNYKRSLDYYFTKLIFNFLNNFNKGK